MSVSQLPPQPASLAKAEKYIADKRAEITKYNDQRSRMLGGMMSAISKTLGDMGVNSLVIGDQHIDLTDPQSRSSAVENRWSLALNEGRFVAALQAGNLFSGYYNKERVDMSKRSLDELVDVQKVRELAPDAVIYGPGDVSPWPDLLHLSAFSIWVDDRAQFDSLWAGTKQWMKTQWHDETMKSSKYPFTADQVFGCQVIHDIAPDLSWRHAQYLRAQALRERDNEVSQWDALAQQEVKKIIGSLLQLEGHPVLGVSITGWLDQLTPVLAHSMEGKARGKRLSEAENKARTHCYEGFKSHTCDWKEWSPASPLPKEGATPPTRRRKGRAP